MVSNGGVVFAKQHWWGRLQVLSFANFIHTDGALACATETVNLVWPFCQVFQAGSAVNPFTPKQKAAVFKLPSH
jgi:hypothetical protein